MKTNRRILTGILFAAVSIFLRPLQAQVTNSGIITAVSAPRQVVNVGQNITLSVTAPTATSFQWKRNGLPIGGATAATYTITGATTWRDNGWYQAVALNATTSTSSAAIFVLVKNPAVAFAWGGDTYGESQVPSVTGELVGIAAGGAFNFLTRADGTLLGFGNGMYNQTSPPEGLSSVVAVALGQGEWLGHALALKADGTISGWGYPYEGLLRFPTTSTGVVALAAGSTHSLALKSDGTVLGWGVNPDGRISIPSGLDNVVAIAAGLGHTLVLRADGTVSGLGSNDDGQLSVPRDLSGVKSIAAGGLFSLALSSDGTVVGWGNNSNGQTTIPAGLTNVVAIAAGTAHCLALKADGTLVAWGANGSKQGSVPEGLSGIVAIAASGNHNLVLHDTRGDSRPSIAIQPISIQATTGSNVTLSVKAESSGTILSYQWRKNGVVILGAISASYRIADVLSNDSGGYDVMVSNYLGSVTSAAATLTVSPPSPPSITTQPVSQSAVTAGTATFSVAATGTEPMKYQWRKDGTAISGATNSSISFSNVQTEQLGSYTVVISNSLGSVTSAATSLSVSTNATYTFSTFAGLGTNGTVDGTGKAAQFNAPWGIAVDSAGNVYVSEGGGSGLSVPPSNVIRKITPAGVVTTLAGKTGVAGSLDGVGTVATFTGPRGLAVDSAGTVYVAANGIRKITTAGVVTTLVPSMYLPSALVFDMNGNLLVAESNTHAIKKVTLQGAVADYAGTGTWGWLDGPAATAQFGGPTGITADSFGNVYVSEYYNATIRKITSGGAVSTLAGRANAAGVTDGLGADSRFNGPLGVAVDIADSIYVADYQNHSIRKISPDGTVVTIAGQGGSSGLVDGVGAQARFNWPAGVAVDRSGNVYVADMQNNVIRKGVPSVIPAPRKPAVISTPSGVSVSSGQKATLSVVAGGFEVSYQWYVGNSGTTGTPIAGATAAKYTTPDMSRTTNYWVRITNTAGTADSSTATVTVTEPVPVISSSSVQSTTAGQSATLSVSATGTGLNYQWYRGASGNTSNLIAGATSTTYATPFVTDATSYWVRITNAGGSVDGATVTAPAPTQTTPTPPPPVTNSAMGLVNMSIRVVTNGSPIIPGIVVDTPLKALIRVAGPSLSQFGVQGVLSNPKVTVYAAGRIIGENDDWGTNEAVVTAAVTKTGAFPFTKGSKDAALVVDLPVGAYTCVVTGDPGTTGEVILEVYRVP
jgi:alpha-tubulin suppressor-like RCC1 family protein